MSNIIYTATGLKKLAEIVRQARGAHTYRAFEELTGVTHAVLRRYELGDVKEPEYITLRRLAPHTPYTVEELLAIACDQQPGVSSTRKYHTAEEVLPIVQQLPNTELARLGQMLFAKLGKLYQPSDALPQIKTNGDPSTDSTPVI